MRLKPSLSPFRVIDVGIAVLTLWLTVLLPTAEAQANLTLKTPPVKIPLNLKNQTVTIIAFANMSLNRQDRGTNVLKLEVTGDLSDLQQHVTELLIDELNKEDRCGDHIAIQQATLTPADPTALAVVHLHFERWTCVKILGKQDPKRLIAGNAVIRVKLTPAVESNNTKLSLVAEVISIDADGSLGELLRAGAIGDMLRDKIKNSVQNAMQKASDLGATIPPAAQALATIQSATFKDGGSGRLQVVLVGEIRISDEQFQTLSKQVKALTQRP